MNRHPTRDGSSSRILRAAAWLAAVAAFVTAAEAAPGCIGAAPAVSGTVGDASVQDTSTQDVIVSDSAPRVLGVADPVRVHLRRDADRQCQLRRLRQGVRYGPGVLFRRVRHDLRRRHHALHAVGRPTLLRQPADGRGQLRGLRPGVPQFRGVRRGGLFAGVRRRAAALLERRRYLLRQPADGQRELRSLRQDVLRR